MFIEFPKVTGVVSLKAASVVLPKMRKIRQIYDDAHITDVEEHIRSRMDKIVVDRQWYAGKRICITAGSRGIPHLDRILRTICNQLKMWGAEPFVIPAMGSHGGGTAEGQLEVLRHYNITEESIGVPILSSMEVVRYGELSNGTPLYCDKFAFESDGIVLLNKVKPHTDFRGPHESGIAKMVAIGISKFEGATAFHQQGFRCFPQLVPEAAEIFLKTLPVVFSVGVVQNAYDDLYEIEFADAAHTMELDAALLTHAKEKMARFKFHEVDVLIVDEIGKEISGYGHDPNVTGRPNGSEPGFEGILKIGKFFIRGLSKQTNHNGAGIAEADVTTRRCLNDIDWSSTWTNLITSTEIQGCKIPMYANNDEDAIRIAIACCGNIPSEKITIAHIKNTLCLEEILVSEGLYEKLQEHPEVIAVGEPCNMVFDKEGNFAY